MPFGLRGVLVIFQLPNDKVIIPRIRPDVFSYLDDIIVVTETFDEHSSCQGKVLDRVTESDFTINPEKNEFYCSEVRYLEFVDNKDGLKIGPDKVEPKTS